MGFCSTLANFLGMQISEGGPLSLPSLDAILVVQFLEALAWIFCLKLGSPLIFSLAMPDLLLMPLLAWHGSVSKLSRRISFEQLLFKSQEA